MTPKEYQELVGKLVVVRSDYKMPWKPEHGKYTLYNIHTGVPYECENRIIKHYWHLARITDVYQSRNGIIRKQPAGGLKGGLYEYKLSYEAYNILGDDTWDYYVTGDSLSYEETASYAYRRYHLFSEKNHSYVSEPPLSSVTFVPVGTWMIHHHNKIKELESFISSQGTIERMAI
jgi:hypothetical protein